MIIKCKRFVIELYRVRDQTTIIVLEQDVKLSEEEYKYHCVNGWHVAADSNLQLNLPNHTYLLGRTDNGTWGKTLTHTESLANYDDRLESLIQCAKSIGGGNKVDPRPTWY